MKFLAPCFSMLCGQDKDDFALKIVWFCYDTFLKISKSGEFT
jgi:hypothetical protein